mmetsp:Transcript_106274/g.298942  ORF Transcript_106274/g.298942 Transcript_106274/m.298942 type:complete len:949 (-) Transcript_106274:54-2900(-)
MPTKLVLGQLVEILGSSDPAGCPPEWGSGDPRWSDAARDYKGHQGQLSQWSEQTGHWLVTTFGAADVPVKEALLRPLSTADVESFDIAVGPKVSPELMGLALMDVLHRRGYARCQLFISPEDMQEMLDVAGKCASEGLLERLPLEIEPGYLGKGGKGKTMKLDTESADAADWLQTSSFDVVETALSGVGLALRPYVESELGFDIHSRRSTLLVLPFDGDEESFEARACDSTEAMEFLRMMHRAKLMTLTNVGPGTASLTLSPKPEYGDDSEVTIAVKPGTLALFSTERYRFAWNAEPKTLGLFSWYLDAPRSFGVSGLEGDLANLGGGDGQAPVPKEDGQVSIVSLATRYASGIDEPWKMWCALAKSGVDTLIEFPVTRWELDLYYEEDADAGSGKSYTKHGGFSDGIELFDCRFFDISPAEARGMDPAQRQVLEVSYIALQGGGYTKKSLQGKSEQVGMFVGIDKNEWLIMPKDVAGGFAAASAANAITSNRVNYCLNLKGPSMTIDTACSASLVATHTARLYLNNRQFDPCAACITTGVNLLLTPVTYISCCGAGMLSHKGRCFTYDGSADGYARGEGTGSHLMKMKPWSRDGGECAVIAASNANQDGRSASLTAPNGPAQERCSWSVLREANISPADVDTCECHGTGTALGDPIEIGAYRKVMVTTPRTSPVIVTSSKSNLGHCEGAAGITGFLKCVLIAMHAEGTPNCHLKGMNPHLDLEGFKGSFSTEGVVHRSSSTYNGVLSFGFGGTNACAQTWGQNIITSRRTNINNLYQSVIKKIQSAPAEVDITGDDWEEWIPAGPELNTKVGEAWSIDIDGDGEITYTPKDDENRFLGSDYYLTGTFNEWTLESMAADDLLDGLFVATVVIGLRGEERFQIVADKDPSMTFHAEVPSCRVRSSAVKGPDTTTQELAWCISGAKGDRYRVEFYKSESGSLSINWVRQR